MVAGAVASLGGAFAVAHGIALSPALLEALWQFLWLMIWPSPSNHPDLSWGLLAGPVLWVAAGVLTIAGGWAAIFHGVDVLWRRPAGDAQETT